MISPDENGITPENSKQRSDYTGNFVEDIDNSAELDAIAKDPSTYEHIDPSRVGNARIIPMSNQAGQSNLRKRLEEAGLVVPATSLNSSTV